MNVKANKTLFLQLIHMIHSGESLSARQVRRKGAAGSCHPKEEGGEALNPVAVSLRLGRRARCSVLFPFRIAPLCALW
jgi:hypothetical protein